MKKFRLILLTTLLITSLSSCKRVNNNDSNGSDTQNSSSSNQSKTITFASSDVVVPMSYEILGNVKRNTNVLVSNEGLDRYPTYGTNLENITEEEKTQIISESDYLMASSSTYDQIDKDGNLYLNGELLSRKMYKHTASIGNYYSDISDSEPAVIKHLSYKAREVGNHLTGLYAPAGEIVEIKLSKETLEATGGVKIEIGQYSQNNEINNIWQSRNDFCRMPHLGSELTITTETGYVASYLGGPIYVTPLKPVEFDITISGACEYTHFIYGLTTEEEFERLKTSTAPYFDLEVYDKCVRHSGPKKYANLDYDNLNKISDLWLKISNISRQIPAGSRTSIGIDFIYDPFIAAGGAVAFVGRNWCNLPPDWMSGSLDYDSFITNGMWGTIHEFNHHYQRFGFAPGDEVTNNAISLLSYISYTKISEDRDNLDGWNRYLNPKNSLSETLSQAKEGSTSSSLNTYADIIHTFGVDTFIKACKYKSGAGGVDNWYESLCETTGYDFSYYFSLIGQTVSDTLKEKYSNLPIFIPSTLNEQSGKLINDTDIITVLPYNVDPSKNYTLNLSASLTIPEGFEYSVKNVVSNVSCQTKNNVITISTNTESKTYITLTLTNGTYTTDVTFIVELCPRIIGINLTTYTYSTKTYKTAKEALNSNFKGYTIIDSQIVKKHFINGINSSQISSYYGKIYMNQTGTYKISVRCSNRNDTYLETSLNKNKYEDSIESSSTNPIDCKNEYITYNVKKGDYIYFRVTVNSNHQDGFAELYGSFTDTLSAINNTYLYNDLETIRNYTFNDLYERTYQSGNFSVPYTNQRIVSYTNSYSEWDENYKIENIIDGNSQTSYHSVKDKMISSEPFEVTIDLGKTYSLNTLNITTYNGNQAHYPYKFELYAGLTLDDMMLIDTYENINVVNRLLQVSFNTQDIRYYKLKILDTSEHRYVAISDINLSLNTNGYIVDPSSFSYTINNNETISKKYQLSTYGYTISGTGEITLSATDHFGIKTINEDSHILVTIDDTSYETTFDKLYYIEFRGTKTIKIKFLNNIDIEYYII